MHSQVLGEHLHRNSCKQHILTPFLTLLTLDLPYWVTFLIICTFIQLTMHTSFSYLPWDCVHIPSPKCYHHFNTKLGSLANASTRLECTSTHTVNDHNTENHDHSGLRTLHVRLQLDSSITHHALTTALR